MFTMGDLQIRDLTKVARSPRLAHLFTELEADVEYVFQRLNGYMDEGYPWVREVSSLVDTQPGKLGPLEHYTEAFNDQIDEIRNGLEYQISKEFLGSLYFLLFPKEQEYVQQLLSTSTQITNSNDRGTTTTSPSQNWRAIPQKITLALGLLAIGLMCLFLPWLLKIDIPYTLHSQKFLGYHFIFIPPNGSSLISPEIDSSRLFIQCLAVAAVALMAMMFLQRTKRS